MEFANILNITLFTFQVQYSVLQSQNIRINICSKISHIASIYNKHIHLMIINSNAQSTDGIYKLKSRGFDFITKSTFFSIITWIITQLQ